MAKVRVHKKKENQCRENSSSNMKWNSRVFKGRNSWLALAETLPSVIIS